MSELAETASFTIAEAKAHLSSLLERVARGEEIIIRRAGQPVAKLVPYKEPLTRRKPGGLRGQIWMSDDFNEPDEEIERLFGMRD